MTPKESAKVIFGVLHDDWFSWTPEVVEAFNMAISALEKQEQDRWIPVTERLPEENGTYLACYEDVTVLLDWFNGKWFSIVQILQ